MVKIVKALEDSDVLMKGVSKGGALPLIPMLLGTLGVSLLTGKGLFRAGSGNKCNCAQAMLEIKEKEYLEQDKELKKNNQCHHIL